MALATLLDVQTYLGNKAPSSELAGLLLPAAQTHILNYLGQPIEAHDEMEIVDANGRDKIALKYTPIISVSYVRVLSDELAPWAEGKTTGYLVRENAIIYIGGCFPRGRAQVVVGYRAGYEEVPADIKLAVCELMALRASETERIGISSKGLAGESITYTVRDLPKSTQAALDQYKKVTPL